MNNGVLVIEGYSLGGLVVGIDEGTGLMTLGFFGEDGLLTDDSIVFKGEDAVNFIEQRVFKRARKLVGVRRT